MDIQQVYTLQEEQIAARAARIKAQRREKKRQRAAALPIIRQEFLDKISSEATHKGKISHGTLSSLKGWSDLGSNSERAMRHFVEYLEADRANGLEVSRHGFVLDWSVAPPPSTPQ